MSNKRKIHANSLEALLAGSLSEDEAKELVDILDNEETHDKNIFMGLGVVKASETLRKKLHEIPLQTHEGKSLFQHRTVVVLITISIIAVLLVLPRQPSDSPTPEEIDQARKELAIAFEYLQKAGQKTDAYVKREIGYTVQDAIITGLVRGIN